MKTTMLHGRPLSLALETSCRGKMKKLVLLLALIFLTSAPAFTFARDGEPQFKIQPSSDGFDVVVSYPEGTPRDCTVKVRATYSGLGRKAAGTQDFEYRGTVHNTGSGWAQFAVEPRLDSSPLSKAEMTSKYCG
jgi:hypothetical protein